MIRFYAPDIETDFSLPETESGHCCRVLRMKEGDILHAVDGKGNAFECVITNANPKKTEVDILSEHTEQKHSQPRVSLAVSPTKNIDRMEWLLEKATEIGIDNIVFLKCTRSERKDVKSERLLKILVSAMKQSMKSRIPDFAGMIDFKKFIKGLDCGNEEEIRIMGYCSSEFPRKELVDVYTTGKDVTILIGPEGDFTPEEVEMSVKAGFTPATFGNTRLRTETAALYAVSAIHVINDLKK